MVRSNDIARKAVTDSFQLSADYVEKNADLVSSAVTDTNANINLVKKLPQTPRILTPPLTANPGSAPDFTLF
jgi:hypothetical protein